MCRATIEDLTFDNQILMNAFDEARRLHQNIDEYIEHSLQMRWIIEEEEIEINKWRFEGFNFYKPSENYIIEEEEIEDETEN